MSIALDVGQEWTVMKMRLIDADALLKKCIEGDGSDKFTEGYNFAVQEISAYIALAPTIGAEPVRQGKWIYGMLDNCNQYYCSECGNYAYWDTDYGQQLFDFCPRCGAKMREGKQDG